MNYAIWFRSRVWIRSKVKTMYWVRLEYKDIRVKAMFEDGVINEVKISYLLLRFDSRYILIFKPKLSKVRPLRLKLMLLCKKNTTKRIWAQKTRPYSLRKSPCQIKIGKINLPTPHRIGSFLYRKDTKITDIYPNSGTLFGLMNEKLCRF